MDDKKVVPLRPQVSDDELQQAVRREASIALAANPRQSKAREPQPMLSAMEEAMPRR